LLEPEDIERLAKYLGMTSRAFCHRVHDERLWRARARYRRRGRLPLPGPRTLHRLRSAASAVPHLSISAPGRLHAHRVAEYVEIREEVLSRDR
jgi:hypothetical protein